MSVYRFPAVVTDNSLKDQMEKIKSEYREAKRAEICYRCGGREDIDKESLGMELLDLIHATETAIRMTFSDQEVEELRAKVIDKNARRCYYDAEHA